MKRSVGEVILYDIHGVCRVEGIEDRTFGDVERSYYILRPVYERDSVIYVPLDNKVQTEKMRDMLTKEQVQELIRQMPDTEAMPWIANDNLRKEEARHVLASRSRKELVSMLKALHHHRTELEKRGKKFHVSDERIMKEAEKILYDEFAYVMDLDRDQVEDYIMSQL